MNLEEAIIHAKEIAESCIISNPKCAQDHLQLAKWLQELLELRNEKQKNK